MRSFFRICFFSVLSPFLTSTIFSANAGIPVIFFNRAVEDDKTEGDVLGSYDKCAFVGTDAPEAGHMQGKLIGGYLVMDFDKVDLNQNYQHHE